MTPDELVMLYFDGELDAAEAEQARELIRTDPAARAAYSRYQLLSAVAARSEFANPDPGDVFSAVMARVANEARPAEVVPLQHAAPRRRPGRAFAAVAGVLALAASVAVLASHAAPSAPSKALASAAEVAAPAGAISAPEPEPPVQSVAIERVDFGNGQGAIFLVPGPEDRTVVVWTDDPPSWTLDGDEDDKGPAVDL